MEAKLVHVNLCAVAFYHGGGMLSPIKKCVSVKVLNGNLMRLWIYSRLEAMWDCSPDSCGLFLFFQEPKSCDLTAMSSQTSFGSSMLCESWFVISAQCIFIHLGVLSYANISMLLFVVCIQSRVLMMTWMHRWLQPTSCPGSSVPCWRRPPPKTTTQTLALRYTQTFSTDFLFSAFSLKQTVVILCAI